MVICFDMKATSQEIWSPYVYHMENGHHFFFIRRSSQIVTTQRLASKGQRSTILCEHCAYTSARSILFHHKGFVEVRHC